MYYILILASFCSFFTFIVFIIFIVFIVFFSHDVIKKSKKFLENKYTIASGPTSAQG